MVSGASADGLAGKAERFDDSGQALVARPKALHRLPEQCWPEDADQSSQFPVRPAGVFQESPEPLHGLRWMLGGACVWHQSLFGAPSGCGSDESSTDRNIVNTGRLCRAGFVPDICQAQLLTNGIGLWSERHLICSIGHCPNG